MPVEVAAAFFLFDPQSLRENKVPWDQKFIAHGTAVELTFAIRPPGCEIHYAALAEACCRKRSDIVVYHTRQETSAPYERKDHWCLADEYLCKEQR